MPGSNWSLQWTNQLLWCGSYRGYLDPFTKPQAGTLHIQRCRIKALCFPATQQGLTDQTLVHTQVFIQKLWCLRVCASMCVVRGCRGRWGKHLVSCLLCFLLPCALQRVKTCGFAGPLQIFPSAWRMPSQFLCVFEGRCWESSCSHHSGQFSWINRDRLTRKHKQVDWPEKHENVSETWEYLLLMMECGEFCIKCEARMLPWCQPLILSPAFLVSHLKKKSESYWICEHICNTSWNK